MNNAETSIESKLRTAWSQEQRFFHMRGIARFLIWAIALVLLSLIIDWQILFRSRVTGTPQMFLLVINLAVLGWVLWREWFRHLKPFDPVRVALEVEATHPELSSVLVSYIQFQGEDASSTKSSQALLDAMREQAISLTRPLDFREVVDFQQLRNLFLFAVVSVAVFSTISYTKSDHMRLLFQRLIGANIDYPTETKVDLATKDVTIKEGQSVEIIAKATGRIPAGGRLFVRSSSDSNWRSMPMAKGEFTAETADFNRTVSEIFENFTYYVRVGDAVSEKFTISVSPRPVITETKVTLTYPDYLQRDGSTEPALDTLNLSVPEGTLLKWTLKCTPSISALDVLVGEEKYVADVSEDGLVATFEISAEDTFKYTFLWTERDNGFKYDDIQHIVRVVPDRNPDIELVLPSADGVGTVKKTINILARVSDDHQLGAATLIYSLNGGEEKRKELPEITGTNKDIRFSWPIAETIPELKPTDRLSYSVEVSDLRPPSGSHINLSATRKLAILTQEQYLAWFKNQLDTQREKIGKARDLEKRATEEVQKLKNEEKSDGNEEGSAQTPSEGSDKEKEE